MHNIECPPLEEIAVTQDSADNVAMEEEELESEVVEQKPCEKCGTLESEMVRMRREMSRTQVDLQEANAQLLEQTAELQKVRNHCQALKDVNRIIKELIGIRDQELTQVSSSKRKKNSESLTTRLIRILIRV